MVISDNDVQPQTPSNRSNFDDLAQKFNGFILAKEYSQAEEVSLLLLSQYPRNEYSYLYSVKLLYLVNGNAEKIVEHSLMAFSIHPQNVDCIIALSSAYMLTKEYRKAIDLLNSIDPNDSNNIDVHRNLSFAYYQLKMFQKYFQESIKIFSIQKNSHNLLSVISSFSKGNPWFSVLLSFLLLLFISLTGYLKNVLLIIPAYIILLFPFLMSLITWIRQRKISNMIMFLFWLGGLLVLIYITIHIK
jgi:tetratricopeptide (TPR) repeat protein